MSNFNVPVANASQSAISLGGEWRNRDKFEANKYKMHSFTNRKRDKHKGNDGANKTNERPRWVRIRQVLFLEYYDSSKMLKK